MLSKRSFKLAIVANKADVMAESPSRFERGHLAKFGSHKLLAALDMDPRFAEISAAVSLDELRKERGGE